MIRKDRAENELKNSNGSYLAPIKHEMAEVHHEYVTAAHVHA